MELAVVAFVVTLLLSICLTVGMLLYADLGLQQAVDVGAQELARLPLPPALEFPTHPAQSGVTSDSQRTSTNPNEADTLFAQPAVRQQFFDESYLVVDISDGASELPAAATLQEQLEQFFAQAPLLNRLLRPLLIVEEVRLDGEPQPRRLLRYPGALVRNADTDAPAGHEDLTVLIPVIRSRSGIGPTGVPPASESLEIEWRAVVEEIRTPSTSDATEFYGPFSLVLPAAATPPASFSAGFVALRLNYPFQAGSLVAYQYRHSDGSISGESAWGEDVENLPVGADDEGVTIGATPPAPYQLIVTANTGVGANAGSLGMGRQYALGGVVRPFRRVLSTQALYRREVFE